MADLTAGSEGAAARYFFLIRRLHSLSGIVPVGVFLAIHLSVNASILAGDSAFQYAVDQIHNLDKLGVLKAVEVAGIFIPLAFHGVVGLMIWLTGTPNVLAYPHGGNIRYALQRWTGVVAMVFILVHLWHMHWLGAPLPGGAQFDPHNAAPTAVSAMDKWWAGPAYLIGVLCAVYHLANGLWTFLITWGITVGPKSQKLSGRICVLLGVVLGLLGLASVFKLKTTDPASLAEPKAKIHAAAIQGTAQPQACDPLPGGKATPETGRDRPV